MKIKIANALTISRISIIPLVVVFFHVPFVWGKWMATLLFIAAAVTDSLDGYLARRLNQMSALGAFLDPVADKLMVTVVLVLLAGNEPPLLRPIAYNPHLLINIIASVIVGREIAVSALREWMAEQGMRASIAVSNLGKLKTIFQMTGLALMIYQDDLFVLPIYELGVACLLFAAVLTLWSMLRYLLTAWPELQKGVDKA